MVDLLPFPCLIPEITSFIPKISINIPKSFPIRREDRFAERKAPASAKGIPVIMTGIAVLKLTFLFFICTKSAHIAEGMKQNKFRLCALC